MIPNNNLSVLPWYTSIAEQNARKWWIYKRVYPLFTPAGFLLPFQVMRPHITGYDTIEVFDIYTKDGVFVGNYADDIDAAVTIKSFAALGYDVIVFPGQLPVFAQFPEGQYYAVMNDGFYTWYSEIFTVVADITPYVKLSWWDTDDFTMAAGTIVYKNPTFKNVLYLQTDIAKPEYIFNEEGESRDGFYFPTKQISEKRYKFSFFASEYLLDVVRLVGLADYIEIENAGQTYRPDTFLITPEWEDNGDVAAVNAEFETSTVAKKLGKGYIIGQRGDFNQDFNDDYNNQE